MPRAGSNGILRYQFGRAQALAVAHNLQAVGGTPGVLVNQIEDPKYRKTTTLFPTGLAVQAGEWLNAKAQEAIGHYEGGEDLVAVPRLQQFMRYGIDGHIAPHADDSSGVYPNYKRLFPWRSLAGLIYLNDHGETEDPETLTYTGGQFVFLPTPAQPEEIVLSPKAGDTVFFPANASYPHYTTKVTGQVPRYVILVFYEAQLKSGGNRLIEVP